MLSNSTPSLIDRRAGSAAHYGAAATRGPPRTTAATASRLAAAATDRASPAPLRARCRG